VSRRGQAKGFNFDLHQALGIYSSLFLMIFAVTANGDPLENQATPWPIESLVRLKSHLFRSCNRCQQTLALLALTNCSALRINRTWCERSLDPTRRKSRSHRNEIP